EPRQYLRIDNIQTLPTHLSENEVDIELRVNRETKEIILYYDGKKIGRYLDPAGEVPGGAYFSIDSRTSTKHGNILKNIRLFEWDARTRLLQDEEAPADRANDALTTDEGDRYSGQILTYQSDKAGFLLQAPHAEERIEIPLDKTKLIHFARPAEGQEVPPATFRVDLGDSGRLALNGLRIEKDRLIADHPILGSLELARPALRKVTRNHTDQPNP
ncbi:MAG: hypothetical protein ACQKBY_01250, partial [Verrucomicrobiales bacterium]